MAIKPLSPSALKSLPHSVFPIRNVFTTYDPQDENDFGAKCAVIERDAGLVLHRIRGKSFIPVTQATFATIRAAQAYADNRYVADHDL